MPLQYNLETAQLDLLRESLSQRSYPGYPTQAARFVVGKHLGCEPITIPDGPWAVDTHSNQRTPELFPNTETQLALQALGLQLDGLGRPLHPWISRMMHDPAIGIVTGKGTYWNWGPNKTVDTVVTCNDHLLLIERADTGTLALPGGFVDPGENYMVAARREVREETGLTLDPNITLTPQYQGPVVDIRATAHAWPETTLFSCDISRDESLPKVSGGDDAQDATWRPIESLKTSKDLFGAHRFLIQYVLGI